MERRPLLNQQKKDIYKLWCDIHQEDDINREFLFFKYCLEIECDIIQAIDHIINTITPLYYVFRDDKSSYFLRSDISISGLSLLEIEYTEKVDSEGQAWVYQRPKIFDKEFEKENDHFVNDNPSAVLKIVSTKVVREDLELLNDWKEDANIHQVETIGVEKTNNIGFDYGNNNLTIGNFDNVKSKSLFEECNNVVFNYCKFEDFVNSLNNPNECNLVVKNKNLLYVLYKFFDDIFGSEAEYRIDQLNEKFSIPKERYSKKNSSYDNYTSKQKELYNFLAEI